MSPHFGILGRTLVNTEVQNKPGLNKDLKLIVELILLVKCT